MKHISSFLLFCFVILFLSSEGFSQANSSQEFNIVSYPRSVESLATGMNGVASSSCYDALTYNPANLLFTQQPTFSYFHQPFQLIGWGLPLNDYSFYSNINRSEAVGFNYENWDWGTIRVTSPESPNTYKEEHLSQTSIAAGFAKRINKNFGIGINFRYASMSTDATDLKAYLFSIGLYNNFYLLNRNWHLGFSIMNLGPAVKVSSTNTLAGTEIASYSAPPTNLYLGLNVNVYENKYVAFPITASMTKSITEYDNGEGQSSFKSLFTDWKDFPNDAVLSLGLAFKWNPIYLGDGFYFGQNFYIGNYSAGIKSGLTDYYTHGADISISYKGLKFSAGYSGIWHNLHYSRYLPWEFPYETFQFSLGVDPGIFNRNISENNSSAHSSNKVIVSAGIGQLIRVGTAKSLNALGINFEQKNNPEYSVKAAFYLNAKSALVTAFSFYSTPFQATYMTYKYVDTKIETITLSSSFRYHPLNEVKPLFMQTGLGVVRYNPVVNSTPKYYYTTSLAFSTGYNFYFGSGLVIAPGISYNLLLDNLIVNGEIIQGSNEFNLGINVGYEF